MRISPMLLLSAALSNLQFANFFERRALAIKILGKKVRHRAEVEPRHQGHAEPRAAALGQLQGPRAAARPIFRSREPRYVQICSAEVEPPVPFANLAA